MMNFKEKPGRSLHMISCHHHTRFSSTTATECLLFVCLVCKSRSRSRPPRKTHRAIKVCKFCSDSMVTQNIHTWNPSRHFFSLKQLGVWGHGSLRVTWSLPIHHMAESGPSMSCLKLISYLSLFTIESGSHGLCGHYFYITNLLSRWLLIGNLGPFISELQMQLIWVWNWQTKNYKESSCLWWLLQ